VKKTRHVNFKAVHATNRGVQTVNNFTHMQEMVHATNALALRANKTFYVKVA